VPDDATTVALADLRDGLSRLLAAAEDQLGSFVDLDADHYWAIDSRAAYDLSQEPELEAGQLSDDVESLRELLGRDEGEVFLGHDLEHVAGILSRIAALALP
jgi:hypothetical protein